MKINQILLLATTFISSVLFFIPGTFAQFNTNSTIKSNTFSTAGEFPNVNKPILTATGDPQVTAPALNVSEPIAGKELVFRLTNIAQYMQLSYTLTYDTDTMPRGITGDVTLSGNNTYMSQPLIFGSCSTGGVVCTFDQNVHNIRISVDLEEQNGTVLKLENVIP